MIDSQSTIEHVEIPRLIQQRLIDLERDAENNPNSNNNWSDNELVNRFIYGFKATRNNSKNKNPTLRNYYLSEMDDQYLQWFSPKKEFFKCRINFVDVVNVSEKPFLNFQARKDQSNKHLLFVETQQKKILILEFDKPEDQLFFEKGFLFFVKKAWQTEEEMKKTRNIRNLASNLFMRADKDGSHTLDEKEITSLLNELHFKVDKKVVHEYFNKYDKNLSKTLDIDEFKSMIKDLMRKPELKQIFSQTIGKKEDDVDEEEHLMEIDHLQQFYSEHQNEQECQFLVKQSTPNFQAELSPLSTHRSKSQPPSMQTSLTSSKRIHLVTQKLNFLHFSGLIFNDNNLIFDPDKSTIHQNMHRPLSEYYINSSHNTYLMSNQLSGDSDIQAYKNALMKGCRCLELDLWDGPNDEPKITHGNTLTSSISLRETLRIIKEYGFIESPFPIILSLENHCSSKVNKRVVAIFKELMGDMIYRIPENYQDFKFYKSPSDLKNKIIIKSKAKNLNWEEMNLGGEDHNFNRFLTQTQFDESHLDELRFSMQVSQLREAEKLEEEQLQKSGMKSDRRRLSRLTRAEEEESHNNTYFAYEMERNIQLREEKDCDLISIRTESNDNADDGLRNAKNIEDISSMLGVHLHYEKEEKFSEYLCWFVHSLDESKVEEICENFEHTKSMIKLLKTCFYREYPKGTRVDSSNYNPLLGFSLGCQIVALNYQTNDENMMIYQARFQENGGINCGYILKPKWMRSEEDLPVEPDLHPKVKKSIYVRVISGQQLKFDDEEKDSQEVISPYVQVELKGHPYEEKYNEVKRTKKVENNGHNPQFTKQGDDAKDTHELQVYCPELAMLIFKVYNSSDIVSWYALPVNCIRKGYRVVPLWNKNLIKIPNSYILVYINIDDNVNNSNKQSIKQSIKESIKESGK